MIAPLIRKHATGWKTLFAFLIAQAVYFYMIFVTIPEVSAYADGLQLLDVKPFGYDVQYVETLMEKLGPEGRMAYKSRQIPPDMIYPLLFAISMALLMAYVLKKTVAEESLIFLVCLIPFFAAGLDYIENFGILHILNEYPAIDAAQVMALSQVTIWKSLLTTLVFLILIPAVIIWFIKRRQRIHLL
jgi:hypothetical protein